jgi:hypothetical protein
MERRICVVERRAIPAGRLAGRLNASAAGRVVAALFWIGLVPAAVTAEAGGDARATAMQEASAFERREEQTMRRRDLNGTVAVIERTVTHRSRNKDEEQVVVETYSPSLEAGRLALSRRIRTVTTFSGSGSYSVEEVEARNPAALSDPMRIVQRIVTTVRTQGPSSSVTDRQVFELDVNGRLVPVLTYTEYTPRD